MDFIKIRHNSSNTAEQELVELKFQKHTIFLEATASTFLNFYFQL